MGKPRNHNEAAERALLGLVLCDPELFWRFKDRLAPKLFFNQNNRKIVSILHKMAEANRLFEMSYISGQFDDDGEFSIDGYLFTLQAEAGARESAPELIEDLEELSAVRDLFDLGQAICAGAYKPDLSAKERLSTAIKATTAIREGVGEHEMHISTFAERLLAQAADAYQKQETIGLKTGISSIDDLFGPLQGGNTYLLAGGSGSGKTAIAMQIAAYMAERDPGAFFSQEMRGTQLAARHLGRKTGILARCINAAQLNQGEFERLDDEARKLDTMRLWVNEQTGLNYHQIRNRLHRLKRVHGVKWAIVDHLLLMGPTEAREDRVARISSNLKGLKEASKILDLPILILGQLKNEYEQLEWDKIRRPEHTDCFGGSAIKQDVDGLVFIYRPEALLVAKEPPAEKSEAHATWEHKLEIARGVIEFSSGKYREGSPEGVKRASFDGPRMEVTEIARQQKPKQQAIDYGALV